MHVGDSDSLVLTPGLRREVRGWAFLAAGSLAAAGIAAPMLGLSRAPGIEKLGNFDWNNLLYWALVPHVVFSFVVWYVAALGGLSAVVAARAPAAPLAKAGPLGLVMATLGSLLLLVPTLAGLGYPSINNYVPVMVHPVYYAGLLLIGLGVTLAVVRMLMVPGVFCRSLDYGVAMAGLAFLVAMVCFAIAWAQLPANGPYDAANLNERVFWGGGHVLQFVNTALMLALWTAAAERLFGAPPLPAALYRLSMVALVVFVLPGPLFYLQFDLMGLAHRNAFTDLLWYGLTLPPAVVAVALAAQLWANRGRLAWRDPVLVGLVMSLLMFCVGGLFGFFLGVSDTRTPSHYHGVIGGVNVAVMLGFALVFLPLLKRPLGRGKAVLAMFWLYGSGQLLWSVGMFIAGAAGVPRKTAGAEQQLDAIGRLGMGISGTAHLIAIAGGVMFVWIALKRLLAKEAADG